MDTSNDPEFDLTCVENRIQSLIPVLESTEKLLRVEHPFTTNSIKERKQIVNNLDSSSYKLWNCVFMKYKDCFDSTIPWKIKFKKMAILKYFACMLLSTHSLLVKNESFKMRVLKCFLRFYYEAIDEVDHSSSKKIQLYLELYCSYIEKNENQFTSIDVKNEYEAFKIEFSILDMQSAFMINDISMAKFYEKKANLVVNYQLLKQKSIINICRLIHNASMKLAEENQNIDAMYFLEQSYLILEKLSTGELEDSIVTPLKKLQIAILSLQAQNCINFQSGEYLTKAESLIKLLHNIDTNNLDCLKLNIKLFEKIGVSKQKANNELMKFIVSIIPNEELIDKLVKFLNSYSKKEPSVAFNGANYIFTNKFNFENKKEHEIAENLFISLIWMITSQLYEETPKEKIELTKQLIDVAEKKFIYKLKDDTIGSLIVLLWSIGKKKMKDKSFEEAISWLRFAKSDFLTIGNDDHNDELGKICRSMLQCCLELTNYAEFKEILESMSTQQKANPLTFYYQFVYHIRNKDPNLALTVLNQINGSLSCETVNLLALCIIEAIKEQSDNSLVSLAIGILLKKIDTSGPSSPILSVALRSGVHLYCKMLDDNRETNIDLKINTIVELVKIYLSTIENLQDDELIDEPSWYASQCFNVGLKLVNRGMFKASIVELFQLAIKVIKMFSLKECDLWIIKSHIIISYIRKEMNQESSNNQHEIWRKVLNELEICFNLINTYTTKYQKSLDELEMQVTIMSFECMMNLGEWDSIIQKVTKMSLSDSSLTVEYNFLMELIYEDKSGFLEAKMKLCEIIIATTINDTNTTIEILMKWERIVFELFGDIESFGALILKQLNMFYEILIKKAPNNHGFEIEWFTSKFWNKGVTIIVESGQITENGDSSFDEISGLSDSSVRRQRGLEWCESAIKFSSITDDSRCSLFKNMLPKLLASVAHENKT